jgi:hypothetical protein
MTAVLLLPSASYGQYTTGGVLQGRGLSSFPADFSEFSLLSLYKREKLC